MNTFRSAIFLLSFFLILSANAQPSKKQILKTLKAKDIRWGKLYGEDGYAQIKMKSSKKWGLYRLEVYEGMLPDDLSAEEIVPPKFDSIGWFSEMEPFTIVKNNDKYGLLLNPYEIMDAPDRVKFKFDAVRTFNRDGEYFAIVRRGSKWGLWDWFDDYYIVEPSFESPNQVPLISVPSWASGIFIEAKKELSADIIEFDYGNGDGVFRARNRSTKKWGMYQSFEAGKITTLIPATYDSLRFFPFNGNYTAVYKGGKVGVYLSYWSYDSVAKQTVPCIYDDYQRFSADGVSKLAVKKNGKWGWVDWLSGEEKSEFKYETSEDLPYPYYIQEMWFD